MEETSRQSIMKEVGRVGEYQYLFGTVEDVNMVETLEWKSEGWDTGGVGYTGRVGEVVKRL